MELLLIRHGLPETVRATVPGEGVDPPLTAAGRAEAALLGRYLAARQGQAPDVVWSSPMRRARETADAIAAHGAIPVHVDDRLREFDHGAPSYTPPELITAEVQATLWRALETGEWGTHRFDPDAFERTVEAALCEIIAAHPSSVVAVVCHSGVINSFVGGVLERPRGMFFRPGYTSVTRVLASGGGRRELLTLNETHQLQLREAGPVTTDSEPTTIGTDPRLLVLHLLRLGGFVAADRLAERAGLPGQDVTALLEQTRADGLTAERNGRISGWMLTKDGRAAHAALLADELERRGARAAVEEADAAFLALNEPFKEICSRWQLRADGSTNDHSDRAYDSAVVEDLTPVHERVVAITSAAATSLPRFGRYPAAFTAARDRLVAGDPRAFAAPLAESYHDAWMELHQDLLSTLGRERSAADGH